MQCPQSLFYGRPADTLAAVDSLQQPQRRWRLRARVFAGFASEDGVGSAVYVRAAKMYGVEQETGVFS